MNYNWNWGIFFQPVLGGGPQTYLDLLISGLKFTICVSSLAWILAFTLGSILGIIRTTELKFLRAIATIYVEIFRNIPLVVQMFLWYYVLPEVLPQESGDWVKTQLPNAEFWSATLCLGFFTAPRIAEQVRAGIQSISTGQRNAALAMGLTPFQTYRYVLLPMAYRIIVPPITSEFLSIFKNSAVALSIGVAELTFQSRQITEYTFHGFEAFTAATILYIGITLSIVYLMRFIEGRSRVRGVIGQGR